MKKLITLLVLNMLFLTNIFAADVPQGMNYQAVARDKNGDVLANKEIVLKVSLLSNTLTRVYHYTEIHKITTNQLGLFSIVIGKGKILNGSFDMVPWSSEEIWMEVAMSEKDESDFRTINASKLYTVPYAFIAGGLATKATEQRVTPLDILSAEIPSRAPCPCQDGIKILQVLYLGTGGVTIKVYRKTNPLAELVNTFTNVNNGDLLLFNASAMTGGPGPQFSNVTYVQVIGTLTTVTAMNTACNAFNSWDAAYVAGATFGSFSVLNHTDVHNNYCTACDVKPNWMIGGNALYDACNLLGTKSNTDLAIMTNNVERMRIFKTGNVDIKNSLSVGTDLTVAGNATLNTQSGSTINNGPFTVNAASPSLLTGTLRVKKQTDLDSGLNVNNRTATLLSGKLRVIRLTDLDSGLNVNYATPTFLSGILRVNDSTTVGGPFSVNNIKPSVLTGTLTVHKDAIFKEHMFITNAQYNSFDTASGALVVAGGVGIAKNLNVGGDFKVLGKTDFYHPVTIHSDCQIPFDQLTYDSYPFKLETSCKLGMAIKVNTNSSAINESNNYISFWSGDNVMKGRIEGQSVTDLEGDGGYINDLKGMTEDITLGALDVAFGAFDIADAGLDLASDIGDFREPIGLCPCVVAPGIAKIIYSAAKLASVIAAEALQAFTLAQAVDNKAQYIADRHANIGVSYQSTAGDYAEYLQRADVNEKLSFGDIVGVTGGKITKNTSGADKLLVISFNPIVLGNLPQQGIEKEYEKVAFMGQVPVKVYGKVNVGDYIVSSGYNNGIGIAVAPSKMNYIDVKNVVGFAWSSSDKSYGINLINVAVGLNANDNTRFLESFENKIIAQSNEINELKNQISETNSLLAQTNDMLSKLVPGFTAPGGVDATVQTTQRNANSNIAMNQSSAGNSVIPGKSDLELEKEIKGYLITGFKIAQQSGKENGLNPDENTFYKKYNADPDFKENILNKAVGKVMAQVRLMNKFSNEK